MNERGFGAVHWLVGLGVVALPLASVVLSLAPWFERSQVASLAAQEAGRHIAVAETWDVGVANATAAVAEITTSVCGEPCASLDVASADELVRGTHVVVEVVITMPAVVLPFIGTITEFDFTVTHRERIDPYRSFS